MASMPVENSILYQSFSVLVRGATINVVGQIYSAPMQRYIDTPARSARLAHVSSGKRVVEGGSTNLIADAQLDIVTEAPSFFVNACPNHVSWETNYLSPVHPCSANEYKSKCLVYTGKIHGPPSLTDANFCPSFSGTTSCVNADEAACLVCRSCFGLGSSPSNTSLHHVYADDWKLGGQRDLRRVHMARQVLFVLCKERTSSVPTSVHAAGHDTAQLLVL